MRLRTSLDYDVPATVACAYLSDPVHRPAWQSSLRGVEVLDTGAPHVGQRWEDHTAVGLVARMRTTELDPPRAWSETGTWRAVAADLSLEIRPYGSGCRVAVSFEVRLPGALAPLGWAATAVGLPAVRSDLARAGRILSQKEHP